MPSCMPEVDPQMTRAFLFTRCALLAPSCSSQMSPLLRPFCNPFPRLSCTLLRCCCCLFRTTPLLLSFAHTCCTQAQACTTAASCSLCTAARQRRDRPHRPLSATRKHELHGCSLLSTLLRCRLFPPLNCCCFLPPLHCGCLLFTLRRCPFPLQWATQLAVCCT
jgi:hypothetical protein